MKTMYSNWRKDYAGMEEYPEHFVAEIEDDLWKLVDLNASDAHGENSVA